MRYIPLTLNICTVCGIADEDEMENTQNMFDTEGPTRTTARPWFLYRGLKEVRECPDLR
jgi:hypothetical protein